MMSGQLRANLRLALRTIRLSKGRSLLTLTGIVFGVAAFIVVVAIGEGIKHQVSGQISQLGKDIITVRAGQLDVNAPLGISGGITSAGALSSNDVSVIQQTKDVKLAVPLGVIANAPEISGKPYLAGPVIATSPAFPELIKQGAAYGNFFNDDSSVTSAVVGAGTAQKLFNEDVPLGESFQLLGQTFVVTGVFGSFDSPPFSLSSNFNDAIFIPYQTAQQLTSSHAPIYEILVKPDNPDEVKQVVASLNRRLEKAHGQHDFTVLTQAQSLSVTSNILSLITKLVVGVAAIALFVGGIGIMDIMLVSVAERMSEIGLRKAVGASNRQILEQFVVEAFTLSAFGAAIGSVLALIVDYLIILLTNQNPILSWQSFVIADFVALAVGVIFGTIPAVKAARKNPIAALRNE